MTLCGGTVLEDKLIHNSVLQKGYISQRTGSDNFNVESRAGRDGIINRNQEPLPACCAIVSDYPSNLHPRNGH